MSYNNDMRETLGFQPESNKRPSLNPSQVEGAVAAIRFAGAPDTLISKVFTPDNREIIPGKDDIQNFWDKPWYDLGREVRAKLIPAYNLVDYNLRSDKYPDGYNGHGLSHIDSVAAHTDELLERAGADSNLRRIGVIASLGHDLGNIIARKGHSLHSGKVFETLVPSVLQNPGLFDSAERIMRLHDELAVIPEIKSWNEPSVEGEIKRLRQDYGPVLPALIIADKTDIGRHRANEWSRRPESIERDEHAFVNFFGEHHSFEISEKEFTWNVVYTPGIDEDEREVFGEMQRKRSAHEGFAAYVPSWLHELHKDGRSSHFVGWQHAFMRIYKQRVNLSAKCAFALFPDIEVFTVAMHDPLDENDLSRGGRKLEETISREYFDEYLKMQDVIYTPKDEKNKERQNGNQLS